MIERLRRPLESLIQENHAFFKTVCRFHVERSPKGGILIGAILNVSPVLLS